MSEILVDCHGWQKIINVPEECDVLYIPLHPHLQAYAEMSHSTIDKYYELRVYRTTIKINNRTLYAVEVY